MHVHLDALGGVAGDMFTAALLDAYPELEAGLVAAVEAATPVHCRLASNNDGVLQGHRFLVEPRDRTASDAGHLHTHDGPHEHGSDEHGSGEHGSHGHAGADRHHRHWSRIKADLSDADLEANVRDGAIAIFEHLARAEAQVHGIGIDDVTFHEVGAWDSIADIVAAAYLVAVLAADSWSIGPIPLGSGRVQTAHGLLPIPAPATALLLRGMTTLDDGVGGERVTPTGAAILRHLCGPEHAKDPPRARTLGRSGIGFGTKTLPGISNCLRVLVFDEEQKDARHGKVTNAAHRELAVIEFEVDDQSAEDLAMGLDRLRAHADVFDVVQMPVFGKKGRMMSHVRVLARAESYAEALAACFRETTTIGLRHHLVSGSALPRQIATVEVHDRPVRVKVVARPGGRTAKAEADDALAHETHAARAALRREAERLALESDGGS